MAFELQDSTVISICVDCVYFNAYGRLDDQTMSNDRMAAEKHKAAIAAAGWPYGTDFTPGCGRDCDEHGIEAFKAYNPNCLSFEEWGKTVTFKSELAYNRYVESLWQEHNAEPEPWFSWAPCGQCGSQLGGDREHATAWTYKTDGGTE